MNESEKKLLFERIYSFLEKKEWEKAEECCDRILNSDPHNAQAYMGLLFSSLKVSNINKLPKGEILSSNKYYKRVMQFADDDFKSFILSSINGNSNLSNDTTNSSNTSTLTDNTSKNNSQSSIGAILPILFLVVLVGYYIWAYDPFNNGPRYEDAKKYALASGGRLINQTDTWVQYEISSINMDMIRFYFNGRNIKDNPPVAGCSIMLKTGMYISDDSIQFTRTMLENGKAIPKGLPIRKVSVWGSTCFEIGKVDQL